MGRAKSFRRLPPGVKTADIQQPQMGSAGGSDDRALKDLMQSAVLGALTEHSKVEREETRTRDKEREENARKQSEELRDTPLGKILTAVNPDIEDEGLRKAQTIGRQFAMQTISAGAGFIGDVIDPTTTTQRAGFGAGRAMTGAAAYTGARVGMESNPATSAGLDPMWKEFIAQQAKQVAESIFDALTRKAQMVESETTGGIQQTFRQLGKAGILDKMTEGQKMRLGEIKRVQAERGAEGVIEGTRIATRVLAGEAETIRQGKAAALRGADEYSSDQAEKVLERLPVKKVTDE